jgi:hypothetical protein
VYQNEIKLRENDRIGDDTTEVIPSRKEGRDLGFGSPGHECRWNRSFVKNILEDKKVEEDIFRHHLSVDLHRAL